MFLNSFIVDLFKFFIFCYRIIFNYFIFRNDSSFNIVKFQRFHIEYKFILFFSYVVLLFQLKFEYEFD